MTKRFLTLLCSFVLVTNVFALSETSADSVSLADDKTMGCDSWAEQIDSMFSQKMRYKLYPTENVLHFLQLDTKTGIIKDVSLYHKGVSDVNSRNLTDGVDFGANTFELYPTTNFNQFLLMNKVNGDIWLVHTGSKCWLKKLNCDSSQRQNDN